MPKPRCCFIGNTHIDHTWTWHWTEGYDEVRASFQAALDRMEEFPEFVFTCASTLHYRWIEEHEPAMFETIRRRVKEGRWQLAGGWVVQSDNNLPCGEALVRQGLYGQRYFRSRFGRQAKVGYCVDSFGHNAQLPQILAGQGLVGWLHFRPDPSELKLPQGPYRWRGVDGTEVIACRPPGWYCTPNEGFFENTARMLTDYLKEHPEALFFYGVGDHGGGPTIRDLKWMRQFVEDHPELECRHGDLDGFYRRAARKGDALPVVRGELQHCFRGCYTTNGRLKELNRRCEGRLLAAETMAAAAAMVEGAPYPKAELARSWDHLLTNHFHDVICGTCHQDAMEEALFRYGGVLETADRVRHFALKSLASTFNRRPPKPYKESLAMVVANSLSWSRREPVEFHPIMPGRSIEHPAVVDGVGQPVELQLIEPVFGTPAASRRLLFAPAVPAGGATLFHVVESPDRPLPKTDLKATATTLESRWWRVRLDRATGAIRSLFDKRRGVELVRRGKRLGELLVMRDLGDTWGTQRDRFGDEIGRFAPTRVRLLESGPLRARFEVGSEYERCTARQQIDLYRDFDFLDFSLEVHWNDKLKTVKIGLPLALTAARSSYEIPYGFLERPPNGEEQPLQRWLRVRGKVPTGDGKDLSYSVGVVADTVGGADVLSEPGKGSEVRLTVLRSPYYGYLTPEDAVEGLDRPVSDQGVRRVRYRVIAGGGRADLGLPEHADALSRPLQIAFEGSQPGTTRKPFSLFRCEPTTVHVAALKQAEEGRGFVVRLVETRGRHATAKLTGPTGYRTIGTTLQPFEIQSWRWREGKPPVRCDLLESVLAP